MGHEDVTITVTTAHTAAYAAGYLAYHEHRPSAPAVDATVMGLIAGMPVGGGAVEVFKEFTRGYGAAAEEETDCILSED